VYRGHGGRREGVPRKWLHSRPFLPFQLHVRLLRAGHEGAQGMVFGHTWVTCVSNCRKICNSIHSALTVASPCSPFSVDRRRRTVACRTRECKCTKPGRHKTRVFKMFSFQFLLNSPPPPPVRCCFCSSKLLETVVLSESINSQRIKLKTIG